MSYTYTEPKRLVRTNPCPRCATGSIRGGACIACGHEPGDAVVQPVARVETGGMCIVCGGPTMKHAHNPSYRKLCGKPECHQEHYGGHKPKNVTPWRVWRKV